MAHPNKEVRELARQIARLEYRLNGLQTPQLNRSSIEDGFIVEYDDEGNEVGIIGRQEDGGHGYNPLTGPVPHTPAAPIVKADAGMFGVAWNGVFLDPDTGTPDPAVVATSDHYKVEVHVSDTPGFIPEIEPASTTRAGAFPGAGGGQLTHVPMDGEGTYYVRLVSVSVPGKFSPPSDEVAVEVPPFVDQAELEARLVDLRDDLDKAAAEIAQTGAELSQRLDTAESDIEAAEGRLSEARQDIDAAFPTGVYSVVDAIASATEFIQNVSVEDSATRWTVVGGGSTNKPDMIGHPGPDGTMNRVARFYARADGTNTRMRSDPWVVDPTKVYRVEVWLRKARSGGSTGPEFYFGAQYSATQDFTTPSLSARQVWAGSGETKSTNNQPWFHYQGDIVGRLTRFVGYMVPAGTPGERLAGLGVESNGAFNIVMPSEAASCIIQIVNAGNQDDTTPILVGHPTVTEVDAGALWSALDAREAADAAMVAANGKNLVTYSDYPETAKPGPAPANDPSRTNGDIHRNRHMHTKEIWSEYMWRASLGEWEKVSFGDEILRSLDVGKLTAGAAAIDDLVAQKIVAKTASILELDVENLVATATSTLNEAVINKLWADVVRSKKITTDMLLVGSGENLIPDPYFADAELLQRRVSVSAPGTQITSNGAVPGAVNRIRLTYGNGGIANIFLGTGTNPAGTAGGEIPVQAGMKYNLTVEIGRAGAPAWRWVGNVTRTDGSKQQIAISPWRDTGGKDTYTWTVPDDVTHVTPVIQRHPTDDGGSGSILDIGMPKMILDGASLIVTGTIGADKIIADEIGAAVGEFVEIEAGQIKAGVLDAAITVSGVLRTSAGNQRAQMDSTGFRYFNSMGIAVFDATQGNVSMRGSLTTKSGAGRTIVDGAGLRHYDDNNRLDLSATGSGVEVRGTLQAGTDGNGVRITSSGVGQGRIDFLQSGMGSGGRIRLDETGGFGDLIISGPGGGRVSIGSAGLGDSHIELAGASVYAPPIYNQSTTGTANVGVASGGFMYRTTSLAESKIAREPLTDWEAVKSLEPITYYDKANTEALAAAIESGDEEAYKRVEYLTRWIGLTAEQAEATGLEGLATYDAEGNLNGVAYDRLAVALIPWLKQLEAEVAALRGGTPSFRAA